MSKTRREFIKDISKAAAFLFFTNCSKDPFVPPEDQVYGPRVRLPNPYVNENSEPILVSVQGTDFAAMLNAGLDEIGGLNRLIDNNQNIFIKPNCNYNDPYPGISSAESVAEIINAARNVTNGAINVGDQGFMPSSVVYDDIGLTAAIAETDATLIELSESGLLDVRRSTWDDRKRDYAVYADIYNAPIIISTGVLKRHSLANLSCALKNNVGAIRGENGQYSREYLHNKTGDAFLREVAEIAGLINPELNIIDARSILTVNGPLYDSGEVVTINRLIICGDMVATDAYCAGLMIQYDDSFSESMITPTLEKAEELGLGTADLGHVEIIELTV